VKFYFSLILLIGFNITFVFIKDLAMNTPHMFVGGS